MKINSFESLPAELMAAIEKECESARAYMAGRGNIRVWGLTSLLTCKDGDKYYNPIDINGLLCDPESMIGAIRGIITGVATSVHNGELPDLIHCTLYIEPTVWAEDDPEDEVYDFLEDNAWGTDLYGFVRKIRKARRAGKTE